MGFVSVISVLNIMFIPKISVSRGGHIMLLYYTADVVHLLPL